MREKTELQRRLEEAYHRDACFCDVLPDASDALAAKDASIREYMDICEDLSRKLEASRHRVAELETSLSAQTRITDAGHRSQKEMLDRIAALEAAIRPFAVAYQHFAWADDTKPFHDDHLLVSLLPDDSIKVGHLRRARSTLEGKHPNAESLAAMQELEDGGGETFPSIDDLMKDLNSDD
jgi:hypothetical protein